MSRPLVVLVIAHALPRGVEWLQPAERAALLRLRAPRRRRDFRVGRFAAKRALSLLLEGREAGSDLRAFEIRPAPGGAPLAFCDGAPLAVTLSISHSNGWGSAAVQSGTDPLGCDIERVEIRDRAFVEDYFAPGEQAFVAAGLQRDAPRRATLVWSAKEAVMKALGQGLRVPPAAVQVVPALTPVSRAGWRGFSVGVPKAAVNLRGSWRVIDDFVLTVAGGSDEPRLLGPCSDAERRWDPALDGRGIVSWR